MLVKGAIGDQQPQCWLQQVGPCPPQGRKSTTYAFSMWRNHKKCKRIFIFLKIKLIVCSITCSDQQRKHGIFTLLMLCEENSQVTGGFPSQRTRWKALPRLWCHNGFTGINSGGRFNIKISFYPLMISYNKDKTVSQWSHLYNENPSDPILISLFLFNRPTTTSCCFYHITCCSFMIPLDLEVLFRNPCCYVNHLPTYYQCQMATIKPS